MNVNVSVNVNVTAAAPHQEEEQPCAGAEQDLLFEFITNGVLLNVIGALGILGNVISMVILSRPQMRSSINYLLVGLARCDTMLILTSVLLFGLPAIYNYTEALYTYKNKVYPHLVPVVYPLALISQTVSVYLTLTVTLERFVAVCHPLRARSLCTYGRARLYVLLIIALSALYNLPRFFEAEIEVDKDDKNNTILTVVPTQLRVNHLYITVYINWLYMALLYFLPFTVLAVLNTAIYRQVRKANKERQRLSRLQKKEIGLATMLLCVVIVFFLCNLLALVNNVMEVFYYCGTIDQLVKTSNLLITINSSVNFIIYVIFGEKFKRLFLKLFCSSHVWAAVTGASATAGRESPDGATHDDSLVSNGDGRGYSMRVTSGGGGGLLRAGNVPLRNGSMRPPRAPSPGPCVYYPARTTVPPPASPSPTPPAAIPVVITDTTLDKL